MPADQSGISVASGVAGIRVLDLTGPSAALVAKWLADLGADVVRVEPPDGDPSRRLPPLGPGGESLHFAYFNTNKRSLTLELESADDRARLLDLMPQVDVLLECFPPGYLAGLGLGPEDLRARNPRLVIGSTTPFGQSGPFRDFRGSELIGWASGGCLMLNGHPERPPVTAPALQAYQVTSLHLMTAVLAALWRRRQTGLGAHLDASVQEAVASMCEGIFSFYTYQGERIVRLNGDHPLACPFQVYRCSDGLYAFLGVAGRQQWETLRDWMAGSVDISTVADEKYLESVERIRDRDTINAVVAAFAATLTVHEFFEGCVQRSLPSSPVRTMDQVLADDQLADRQFFVALPGPQGGPDLRSPGLPFRGRAGRFRDRSAGPPAPGAHTDDVLREWREARPVEAATGDANGSGPLAGIKVLDFTWFIAGPTTAQLLGDLGAEVIKVEAPGVGDPVRGIPPFFEGRVGVDRSGTFHALNRNKRGLTLDLKHPSARAVIERLARWADVVVENFTHGTLDRLGIGYEALSSWNPRVILTSLTGYGQTGPQRSWPSYHPTASAASGITGLFAYRDSKPIGFANSYFDYVPGYVGAVASIEALLRRAQTGRGEHMDVAQIEAATSLAGPELLTWQANGVLPVPEGNQAGALGAPLQDVYACRGPDTWLAVTVPNAAALAALARLLGQTGEAAPDEVDRALAAWLRDREAWDAFETLQKAGVPAGVAEHGPDLVHRDVHLRERALFLELPHAEIGRAPLIRYPILFDGRPLPVRRSGPLIGEHTEEILRDDLGFTEEEVVELIAGGAV